MERVQYYVFVYTINRWLACISTIMLNILQQSRQCNHVGEDDDGNDNSEDDDDLYGIAQYQLSCTAYHEHAEDLFDFQ